MQGVQAREQRRSRKRNHFELRSAASATSAIAGGGDEQLRVVPIGICRARGDRRDTLVPWG